MDLYVLSQMVPVGGYVSGYKVIPIFLICLAWWRLLTWIDKDAPAARLPREYINIGMIGAFILGFILFLLLPGFWIALPVFILVLIVSVAVYLIIRHQQVGIGDLVRDFKNMDLFKGGPAKKVQDVAGMVTIMTKDGRAMVQPEPESPERPAYDAIQMMMTEPLRRNMERLDLVSIEGGMMVQYWVDGVVYNGAQFNKSLAQSAITVLKRVAGLDLNEKRKPQSGIINTSIEGKKHEVQVQTAGSASGESMRLLVDPRKRHELKLEELGLSQDQHDFVENLTREPDGVVLVSVPKGQGLTTAIYAIIRRHDAFLSHIQSIERAPEDDLEGITQTSLAKGASPQEEHQQVQWVISQEPDVILMPDIQNPKSARELIAFATRGKRVYVGMRANTSIDAINEWRQMVGDDDLATKALRGVVAGRQVRKLCPACKQPYQPDPETLRKLNLDHGKAQQFFQARTQPLVDQKGNPIVCTFCAEMRYRGRTGVYEVMPVNEEVRQAILANSSVNQLRALFRKMRGRFIQEQALELVEQGETSIQEVLRAMRGQEQDPRVAKGAASATGSFTSSGSGINQQSGSATRSGTQAQQPPGGGAKPPRQNPGGRQ